MSNVIVLNPLDCVSSSKIILGLLQPTEHFASASILVDLWENTHSVPSTI